MISPDKVILASQLPTYINIGNKTGSLTISGTVADSTQTIYSVTIGVDSNNNRSDIFATNQNTNLKCLLSTSNYLPLFQAASFEYVTYNITYNASSITVAITVNNFSGGPVTLITQTYLVKVVQYQIPF